MNKKVIFEDLGLIDYKKCWDYQEDIFSKTIEHRSPTTMVFITYSNFGNIIYSTSILFIP